MTSRNLSVAFAALELACVDPTNPDIKVGDAVGIDTDTALEMPLDSDTELPNNDTATTAPTDTATDIDQEIGEQFLKIMENCVHGVPDSSAPLSLTSGTPDLGWIATLHTSTSDAENALVFSTFNSPSAQNVLDLNQPLLLVQLGAPGSHFDIIPAPEGDIESIMSGLQIDNRRALSELSPTNVVFSCFIRDDIERGYVSNHAYNDVAGVDFDGLTFSGQSDGDYRLNGHVASAEQWNLQSTEAAMNSLLAKIPDQALSFNHLSSLGMHRLGGVLAGNSENGSWVFLPAQ